MNVIDLNYYPVAVENHGAFVAPDPWDGNRVRTWHVVGYQMHTSTIHPPYPPAKNGSVHDVMIGIESASEPLRYRVMPLSLQPLFHEGALPPEKIPALLHRIEGNLRSSDYPPRHTHVGIAVMYLIFAILIYAGAYAARDELDPRLPWALTLGAYLTFGLSALSLALAVLAKRRRQRLAERARRLLHEL